MPPIPGYTVVHTPYASHTRVYPGIYTPCAHPGYTPVTPCTTLGIPPGYVTPVPPGYTSGFGRSVGNEARLYLRLWEKWRVTRRVLSSIFGRLMVVTRRVFSSIFGRNREKRRVLSSIFLRLTVITRRVLSPFFGRNPRV